MKIYVASSWRNETQPIMVQWIRDNTTHDVYDFRSSEGFHWKDIDPDWEEWTADEYRKALKHTLAQKGFAIDMKALEKAGATLLVLPCGASAHLELGYACGNGQFTAIYMPPEMTRPELMYKMADQILTSMVDLQAWVKYLETQ